MADLSDRIAEVLHDHYPLYCNEREDCDTGNYVGGWAKHAAEAVVAAIQLTPEWCARHESGGGGVYHSEAEAREFLDSFVERPPGVEDPGSGRYVGLERRWVTPWVGVLGEEQGETQ